MIRPRRQPPQRPTTFDMCDHFDYAKGRRCSNYWRHSVILTAGTKVLGKVMYGTYRPGEWRFCNMHHRIFQRDRVTPPPATELPANS
jgi:hypothetical protein